MCCDCFLRRAICGDHFTDFRYVKINGYFADFGLRLTAILQTLNKLRAISGLKNTKCEEKLTTKLIHQINTTKHPKIKYIKKLNNVDIKQL